MGQEKYFGATLRWHWIRTGVVLLLFAEYLRLVLTTDAPPHRLIVTAFLGLVFAYSLITLIRVHLRKTKDGVRPASASRADP